MKINQSGRSMVEMLGVLAIIGVLSVGGLAGYSKAMTKYKLNKQASQLNQVLNTAATYYKSFSDVAGSITTSQNMMPILIKLGEIPREMIKPRETNYIYDVFNTKIDFYIYPADKRQALVHMFPEFTKKSIQNMEICRNILYTLKENAGSIYSVGFVGNYTLDEAHTDSFLGNSACSAKSSTPCLATMTQDQIYTACSNHYDKKSFWIDIWFRY